MFATMTLDPETRTDPEVARDDSGAGSPPTRRHAVVPTDLGDLTLVAEGDLLVGVYFPGHRPAPPESTFGGLVDPVETDDPVLVEAATQLVDYAGDRRTTFDLPVAPLGSERARQVWDLIAAVPRGETTTYAALGRAVGIGPRAAGQFVARNPLSVVVPCHRVVASDGRLTGYAGGIDRKRWLLELEGVLPAGATAVRPAPRAERTDGSGPEPEVDVPGPDAAPGAEASGR